MELFANIFYLLIGILPVVVTLRSPLRLCYNDRQMLNNKPKYVYALTIDFG